MGKTVSQILVVVGTAVMAGATGGIASAGFWITVAKGATLVATGMALAPKPKLSSLQQQNFQQQSGNRSLMIKQPIINRDMVFGESKKSGGIVFMESTSNFNFMHIVIQLASHEIQSFEKVYFNEDELTIASDGTDSNGETRFKVTAPSKYATSGMIRLKLHKGSDSQLADADLVSESSKWTNDHRLRGISYIYARLEANADAFPNGVPNISAEIKGKKLLDFRTSSTSFSSNPALAIFDYLTDSKLGLNISTNNIDTTSFTTMANLCDENVPLSAGGTEKRYTCNGVIYANIQPQKILEDLLTSCAGVLSYSNGKFILKGGQFTSPSITLTDDDFVSSIEIESKKSRKDLFNTVKGIFTSEESDWQPSDYPMVSSSTFVTEDGGEKIFADIDLPFTTSSVTAQRIAKIALFKNRQQIVLSAQIKLTGFKLEVGDTVNITNTRLGFSSKVFEVAEWKFSQSITPTIMVILQETSSSVYDWSAEENVFTLDNTTLPSVTDVSAPSLTVTDTLRAFAETPITVLEVTVSSGSGTANEFEVEAQNTNITGSSFVTLGRSKNNVFELVNAEDGATYNVRARTINAFNVHSEFTTVSHEVVGKTAPPSDVTNFSSNVVGDLVSLSWTPVSDLDLSHYIIRHNPLTTGTKYEEGLIVAQKVARPANTIVLPAQTGTYMIKAVDVLGLESTNSTKSVVILNSITRDFNVVATATEHPNFSGTKEELEVVERDGTKFLEILEGELFDNGVGLFDSQTGNFDDGGSTGFNLDGLYDFPVFDLGAIYNSRVTFVCKYNRFDTSSLFDSRTGRFDAQDGLFDGSYDDHNDVNVELLISTSDDNSTYTDFRNYVLGDYKARFIKLRAKLTTTTQTASPAIYELSATVDMPDRTIGEDDVASGTSASGKVITFNPAFKELQGLGISAQSLATGDFYELTSKTPDGFTIKFKNSSGSVVSRNFDYVAKGFGYVET
tara:strand:- start:4290 stop:7172 length:2883 start_codon:yes stop_codon:yes gene_type:complete